MPKSNLPDSGDMIMKYIVQKDAKRRWFRRGCPEWSEAKPYIVLRIRHLEELCENVDQAMIMGYKPVGNVGTVNREGDEVWYIQAMTREED